MACGTQAGIGIAANGARANAARVGLALGGLSREVLV
jgi:hypothetical protein